MTDHSTNDHLLQTTDSNGQPRWNLDALSIVLRERLRADVVQFVPFHSAVPLCSPLAISPTTWGDELHVWSDGDHIASITAEGVFQLHPAAHEWSGEALDGEVREGATEWWEQELEQRLKPRGYRHDTDWETGIEDEVRHIFIRSFDSVDDLVAELEFVRGSSLADGFDASSFDGRDVEHTG